MRAFQQIKMSQWRYGSNDLLVYFRSELFCLEPPRVKFYLFFAQALALPVENRLAL
jgi:hypothetical protein